MEDFQSKVLASDGVVENPQNKDQLPERAKYWHWKMTVSQKLFGKYQEDLQTEVLEWEDNGTPEALWQIWRTFRAKYWHGKMTVSRKLFGKYGGPSEPSTGIGRRWYLRSSLENMEDFHFQNKVLALEDDDIPEALWQISGGPSERMGRRRYPRSSSAIMEDLQRKVLEWEDDGTPDALQHQKDPQSNVLALEDDGTPEVLWQIRRTLRAKNWACLLYTSPSPRDEESSRMPSSA